MGILTLGEKWGKWTGQQFSHFTQDYLQEKFPLISGIENICRKAGTNEVIFAGIGSGLIAKKFGGTNLSGALGPVVDALPAFAVREVAERDSAS